MPMCLRGNLVRQFWGEPGPNSTSFGATPMLGVERSLPNLSKTRLT